MAVTGIAKVFVDIKAHKHAADLIRKHSSNKQDIRERALIGLDLHTCRNILDLGCGFGFFTEAIQGKVHPEATVTGVDVIGGYRYPFLEACRRAGMKGRFLSSGAALVRKLPPGTFDLVLCSYALYFFPRIIAYVSKIMQENGIFVAITHNDENMQELIAAVKEILPATKRARRGRLPVEKLIAAFSSENGHALLAPWFGRIEIRDYENSLIFHPGDLPEVVEYFRFKSPFFLAGTKFEAGTTAVSLAMRLQQCMTARKRFIMTKDDSIFICSNPLAGRK